MPDKKATIQISSIAILLILITSIPYLIGFFNQGELWRFSGFIFGVEDGNSYIAKMLSGANGNWLFRSPYTNMEQAGTIAFLPYILLGKLAGGKEIHDQLVSLFQIFRGLSIFLLVYAVYRFISIFIQKEITKLLASWVILAGGGLGWMGWLLFPNHWIGRMPLELYSPEAFGFLSILGLPHLIASRAFLLLGFSEIVEKKDENDSNGPAIRAGLWFLAAGFFQPLTIAAGYGVLGIYTVLNIFLNKGEGRSNIRKYIRPAIITAVISSPWILYNMYSFSHDNYLRIWYSQNLIPSPPVFDYLWSYGLFFLAGIPAALSVFKNKNQPGILLISWVICAVSLAYIPYNVQRRFIDGIWIALVLLAFISMQLWSRKTFVFFTRGLLGTTVVAPILILIVVISGVWNPSKPVYRTLEEVELFRAVGSQAIPGDVVLCGDHLANPLPAWAPVYVLTGHGPESANASLLEPRIEEFYSGRMGIDAQKVFLQTQKVKWILSGPAERSFGDWEQKSEFYYSLKFSNANYRIYKNPFLDN
jgi:hypothetical protein